MENFEKKVVILLDNIKFSGIVISLDNNSPILIQRILF